jgi:hypothetical protein
VLNTVEARESLDLIRNYLHSPDKYWPDSNPRQVDKLDARLCGLETRSRLSRNEIIDRILALTELRHAAGGETLFLVNAGSSGSHWIEAMLAEFNSIACLGEVYFSPNLRQHAKQLGPCGAGLFIHGVHLAHGNDLTDKAKSLQYINSAHVTDLSLYRDSLPDGRCILLCRDPYDIVVSRAFRKDKYRKYIAGDMDDDAYLDKNITFVKNFYHRNLKNTFDAVIRYEDFLDHPRQALRSLLQVIGVVGTDEQIDSVVGRHDRAAITSGKVKDSGNYFLGSRQEVNPVQRTRILKHLEPLRLSLGFQPMP